VTEAPPEEETVTVTFISNGGSAVAPVTLLVGETLGDKYVIPTKGEDFFLGWFEGVTEYTDDMPINVDLTLTAGWASPDDPTVLFATVFFDSDGGLPAYDSVSVVKGKALGPRFPVDPIKQGFKFTGWVDADGEEFILSTRVTESDINVTVQWEAKTQWTVTLKVPSIHQSVNKIETLDEDGEVVSTTFIDGMTFKVYDGDGIDDWKRYDEDGNELPQFPRTLNCAADPDANRFYRFFRWSDDGTANGIIYTERTPITKNVTLTGYFGLNFHPKTFPVDLSTYGYYRSNTDNRNIASPYTGTTASSGTVVRTPAAASIVYYSTAGTLTLGSKSIDVPAGSVSARFNANPSFLWFYNPEDLLTIMNKTGTSTASVANETKFSFFIEADLYNDDGDPISQSDTNYQFNVMLAGLRNNDNWNATVVNGFCLDQINGKMNALGEPIGADEEPVPLPHDVAGTITNFVQNRYWIVFRARADAFAATPATLVIKSMKINLLQ